MLRLLALDFDGVVSDSAPEAFVVALRTYCEMRQSTNLHDSLCFRRAPATRRGEKSGPGDRDALLRGPAAPAPEAIADDALFAAFLEMMPLGNRAEDYAVGLDALDSGVQLPDQTAYDRFKADLDPEWMRSFHKRFYRVRAAMTDADPAAWHRLMGPYPAVTELLRRRAGDALLAIATSKDRRSVGKLLEAYGIADLFPEGRVLDKETGVSKRAHLEHLHRVFGFPYTEMTFIDDKVNHLDAVAPLGVRCGLAAWGYNGEREVALARARGHLVLGLEDAEARLFGHSRG